MVNPFYKEVPSSSIKYLSAIISVVLSVCELPVSTSVEVNCCFWITSASSTPFFGGHLEQRIFNDYRNARKRPTAREKSDNLLLIYCGSRVSIVAVPDTTHFA